MRARALVLLAGLGLWSGVAAQEAAGRTSKPAAKRTTLRCRVVPASRHARRHKVCVRVKPKPKTTARPPARVPSPPPARVPTPPPTAGTTAMPPAPAAPPALPPVAPAAPAPSAPPAPVPSRLQATTREFSIRLSRARVPAGPLILQLVNAGEDEHDLHVRPASGGPDALALDLTDPFGGTREASQVLGAGDYVLYCSLPGHEEAGMRAPLEVR